MKIIHVEDHLLFAQGLKSLADQELPDMDWIIVPTPEQVFELLDNQNDIGLVLLDLSLTGMSGLSFLRTLQLRKIVLPVVLMTASLDFVEIKAALDQGAMGIIPKSSSIDDAMKAIKLSIQGMPFIPPEFQQELSRVSRGSAEKRLKLARAYSLTDKQLEVLELLQNGLANVDIAEQLGVSDNAVKYHVKVLYRSFDVSNRVECVRYAERKGLI